MQALYVGVEECCRVAHDWHELLRYPIHKEGPPWQLRVQLIPTRRQTVGHPVLQLEVDVRKRNHCI